MSAKADMKHYTATKSTWLPLAPEETNSRCNGMLTGFHSRRVHQQRWWCWSVSSSRLSDLLWWRTDGEPAEIQVSVPAGNTAMNTTHTEALSVILSGLMWLQIPGLSEKIWSGKIKLATLSMLKMLPLSEAANRSAAPRCECLIKSWESRAGCWLVQGQQKFVMKGSPKPLWLIFCVPESFMMALAASASSPHGVHSSGPAHLSTSGSPSSPPAWTRLSDRPPGLKTYRSSSRGALRLTIKQESGSRKVVHNSACDPGLKRDHTGQLTNGGGAVSERQASNGTPQNGEDVSNGVQLGKAAEEVSPCDRAAETQTAPNSKTKAPNPLSMPEPQAACFELPTRDVSAPKLKCYRPDPSPRSEQRFSPPPAPLQEDNMLSEHLQSAIDSILELQRLQGPSAAQPRATSGPTLDQAVTSILEGHL